MLATDFALTEAREGAAAVEVAETDRTLETELKKERKRRTRQGESNFGAWNSGPRAQTYMAEATASKIGHAVAVAYLDTARSEKR